MKKLLTCALLFAFAGGLFALPATAQEKKKADPEARFKRLDKNADGKLSFEEFKGKREGEKAAAAEKQFKRLDKNSDGSVTLEEFKAGRTKKKKNA